MGTNYYAVRNRPSTYGGIHIGKSSIGWKFLFQEINEPWSDPPIEWHTWNQVREWLHRYCIDNTDFVIMGGIALVERQPNTQYVLSWSGGKDSTACLQAIKLLGYPLDRIVKADIWATDTIRGEDPETVAWEAEAEQRIYDLYGIRVEHFCAMTTPEKKLRSQISKAERERERERERREPAGESEDDRCKFTYEDGLYQPITKRTTGFENRIGLPRGFPYQKGPWCQRDLKVNVLNEVRKVDIRRCFLSEGDKQERIRGRDLRMAGYKRDALPELPQNKLFSDKRLNGAQKINTVHYIGIAADEPERIAKYSKKANIVLPLVDIGWDEALCGLECKYLGLLSPKYESGSRDGCWFCHNQGIEQLRRLRHKYPDLWALMLKWDNDSPTKFHADGHTVHDFDRRFQLEDDGIVDPNKRWFWYMLDVNQMTLDALMKERE